MARGLLPDRSKAVEGDCTGRDARARGSGQRTDALRERVRLCRRRRHQTFRKRNLDHPDFYQFYAKAEKLSMPVCVHVSSNRPATTAERFDNPFFVHATTHAFEQMIGVMYIVGE